MKSNLYSKFKQIDMRVGKIIKVAEFPEAMKPAYKLLIDFGKEIGVRKSRAQVTNYTIDNLLNKTCIGVVNLD